MSRWGLVFGVVAAAIAGCGPLEEAMPRYCGTDPCAHGRHCIEFMHKRTCVNRCHAGCACCVWGNTGGGPWCLSESQCQRAPTELLTAWEGAQ
jgi:hypothetical protein